MSLAYRSAYDHIVGVKLAETEDAREQLRPLMPGLRTIAGKRIARIVAGAVGVSGAVAMTIFAIATSRADATVTYTLIASAIAGVATWASGRGLFGIARRLRRRLDPPLQLSGELGLDLARIEATDPRSELQEITAYTSRLEVASIAMPIAGVALVLPLLLHLVFITIVGKDSLEDFGEWIRVSLVIVGHAHIALVVLGILFARKLHKMTTDEIGLMRIHREWAKIWLIVIGISCLPGIILFLVPPLIVAVTGIAFIPLLFTFMYKSVLSERTQLAFAESAARVRVGAEMIAPRELFSAKEEERETNRDDEYASADPRDGDEREPLLVAAHRVVDDGSRR